MPQNTITSLVDETELCAEETYIPPCMLNIKIAMEGGDEEDMFQMLAVFNSQILVDIKWEDGAVVETESVRISFTDLECRSCLLDNPIVVMLRTFGKVLKETDPYLNPDNKIGASIDLLPLVLGEDAIFTRMPLVYIDSGEISQYMIEVNVKIEMDRDVINPLTMTMISAHCLPLVKEGTLYVAGIGLDTLTIQSSANFGNSYATSTTPHVVWANVSQLQFAASTQINVPDKDYYVPPDLHPKNNEHCNSAYWYSMKRVSVEPANLAERLQTPFFIDVAGIGNPKVAKKANDIRCRYMGMVDARALLEPGVTGLTVVAKLTYFNEANIPAGYMPVLDLGGSPSAKTTARDNLEELKDEHNHDTYVKIRFDLMEPLTPIADCSALIEKLELSTLMPIHIEKPYDLFIDPEPIDPRIDVHKIHKECGALAVHNELTALNVPIKMPQSIKRNAASRLILRVRSMVKQFPPGECSQSKWQDTVTHHHSASRRAVIRSFEPQPPPPRLPSRFAATHAKMLEDDRISNANIDRFLKVAPNHPLSLLTKAMRCLEKRNDTEACNYLRKALNVQNMNRYLLWAYAAQEFNKGEAHLDKAIAALLVSLKGDNTDGTANVITWTALHAVNHYSGNEYAACIAAMEMRHYLKLPKVWPEFLKTWEDYTGRREIYWVPEAISQSSPLLISAAFFLCLRGYGLVAKLLKCYKNGCDNRGAHKPITKRITPDAFYINAASCLLRRDFSRALKINEDAITKLGPSEILCQMRLTCQFMCNGWSEDCEQALHEAVSFNSQLAPALLLRSALHCMASEPEVALQRATYAHKLQPSPYSALIIGRVFKYLKEMSLAERWAAQAVKMEALLSDGWAFLSLLALYERNVPKARALLRTAYEAGPISDDILSELKQIMVATGVEELPETLVKNLCFCDYY